jgi:hypothetical protein
MNGGRFAADRGAAFSFSAIDAVKEPPAMGSPDGPHHYHR